MKDADFVLVKPVFVLGEGTIIDESTIQSTGSDGQHLGDLGRYGDGRLSVDVLMLLMLWYFGFMLACISLAEHTFPNLPSTITDNCSKVRKMDSVRNTTI